MPADRSKEGYCAGCNHWFRMWPTLEVEHDDSCPVCQVTASVVITRGAEAPL